MNKKKYIDFIILILLGMLTSFSLPPFNYFMINFLTFTYFFLFLNKKYSLTNNKKIFFIYGWFFGFGYFLTNLYWISVSLTFDDNFKFLIPLTIFLIPAFLALFYGLISYLFVIFKPKKILSSVLTFSLIFGSIEFVRGSILTGFPWNLIVYSFANQLEILSITTIVGTYGLNLFCISLFTSPAVFILKKSKKDLGLFLFFIICFIFIYVYGSYYKEKFDDSYGEIHNYKLRVIGSNVSLDRFYSNIDAASVIDELIKLSDPNKNEKTIFIWPEGILPNVSQQELVEFKGLFSENFSSNHLFIIGINKQFKGTDSIDYYNSFSLYDDKLNLLDSYNKIKLVPFGEFLPFDNLLSAVGFKSLTNNYQSFSSGNQREFIEIKQQNFSLKILPLICYEIIYSGKLFNDNQFDLIINISEDGWFGKSIGPKQHFVHSIFRAIESGKYVLRSSNNGIAAIINPLGEIDQRVNFGQSGYIDLKSSKEIQPTIFSKYGNKIFGLLILLYIFLIFSFNKIKNE